MYWIQEHWDMNLPYFHVMFGDKCIAAYFSFRVAAETEIKRILGD